MQHNCAECRYLTRTSPTQVFLLCEFWSARQLPVKGASSAFGYGYVLTHCHMQPEAAACPFFKARKVSHGAASDSRGLLCAAQPARA